MERETGKKRIQSPSSILTHKKCPRKYYYEYVLGLPTKPSIHKLRGNIIHTALEQFFKDGFLCGDTEELRFLLLSLFKAHWNKNLEGLNEFDVNLDEFYNDSSLMLVNWFNQLSSRIDDKIEFSEAFSKIVPKETERMYVDEQLGVRGIIDVVESNEEGIRLMDYKTSKADEFTEEYRLQLAIYALLYESNKGVRPDKVGIYFLKFGEKTIEVDDELIKIAKEEVNLIHEATKGEDIKDYNKKPGPLCKGKNYECDFFNVCKPF